MAVSFVKQNDHEMHAHILFSMYIFSVWPWALEALGMEHLEWGTKVWLTSFVRGDVNFLRRDMVQNVSRPLVPINAHLMCFYLFISSSCCFRHSSKSAAWRSACSSSSRACLSLFAFASCTATAWSFCLSLISAWRAASRRSASASALSTFSSSPACALFAKKRGASIHKMFGMGTGGRGGWGGSFSVHCYDDGRAGLSPAGVCRFRIAY